MSLRDEAFVFLLITVFFFIMRISSPVFFFLLVETRETKAVQFLMRQAIRLVFLLPFNLVCDWHSLYGDFSASSIFLGIWFIAAAETECATLQPLSKIHCIVHRLFCFFFTFFRTNFILHFATGYKLPLSDLIFFGVGTLKSE